MEFRRFLEWTIIAVAMLSFIVWISYANEAQAWDCGPGYCEEDQGGLWLDPNAPVQPYQRRPYPVYRSQPYPVYGDSDPYYYGDIDQQPDLIIYRGGRRFTTH